MCEPVTLALVGASVLGAGLSAAGQIQEGNAAKKAADFRAQVSRNNAVIANQAAAESRDRGEALAGRERLRTRQALGSARATLAGQGVVIDEGTALNVTQDIAQFGELDVQTILSNAEREARGFEQRGVNFQSEAQLTEQAGRQARTAGRIQAASTLLTGGGQVANRWINFGNAGAF